MELLRVQIGTVWEGIEMTQCNWGSVWLLYLLVVLLNVQLRYSIMLRVRIMYRNKIFHVQQLDESA